MTKIKEAKQFRKGINEQRVIRQRGKGRMAVNDVHISAVKL